LDRARRAGELKFTRKGGRIHYLGAWILDWIAKDEPRELAEAALAVAS